MNWFFWASLIPAIGLYMFFKLKEKNLLNDWNAIFKDGLASGFSILWLGASIVISFKGWPEYIGWFLVIWSVTYWASAVIAWQKLRAPKQDKPLPQSASGLNRQQRRRAAHRR
ncbi:hypothetical protein [Anthocerotibacter panamensis]|uniref:hypothetical protein n=1 Tax=Anthocerotibacter panamensis TaxID=2857077 RepID=UPI001C403669|nr:hypothetical protein [Anthocerotibacter panamensis]